MKRPAEYDADLELWKNELSELSKKHSTRLIDKGIPLDHISTMALELFLRGVVHTIVDLAFLAEGTIPPQTWEPRSERYWQIKRAVDAAVQPIFDAHTRRPSDN